MPRLKYKSVDEYIADFPKDTQVALRKLYKAIKSVKSDFTEGISYGIPTFYLNGKYLVYFAGFNKHVSVYPATTRAVNEAGLTSYKVSKGTLKFPLSKPIPYDLINKFVKFRVKETLSN